MTRSNELHDTDELMFASPYYQDLAPLCLAGLARTLNPRTHLYDRQLRNARLDTTIGTEAVTSTCICLIGLDRAGVDLGALGLDPLQSLSAVVETMSRSAALDCAGLLVWANAVHRGSEFDALCARLGLTIDQGFLDSLTTMELAWLLSGLLHEMVRTQARRTIGLAEMTAASLRARFCARAALMNHAGDFARLTDRLRGAIANFADQIYSVQAFSFASIVLQDAEALAFASRLGGRLVQLQGPLGQWWWHYDVRTGGVAERFPVYSVHQHAMAPMALMALRAAGGADETAAIERGQAWVRHNELGVDLVDPVAGTVWRDIERREPRLIGLARKARHLFAARSSTPENDDPSLVVNFETRPYEWAWCLYAGAIQDGFDRRSHIV